MHLRLPAGPTPTQEQLAYAYLQLAQEQVDRDDVRIAALKREHAAERSKLLRRVAQAQIETLRLRRENQELHRRLDQLSAAGAAFTKAVRQSRG
jgi:hypothetical protein